MKALTVRQPWAWAIIHGGKGIENRSWPIRYRGPLVIHAGRSRQELAADYSRLMPTLPPPDSLAFGQLIGVVDVVDCVPLEQVKDDPFAEGPWCWILGNPRPIQPLEWKGSLGIFVVPEDRLVYLAGSNSGGLDRGLWKASVFPGRVAEEA